MVWNVRGINDPGNQREVKDGVYKEGCDLIALLETRVKVHNSNTIVQNKFAGMRFINNYDEAPNGRIWIPWKQNIQVVHLSTIDQCITCRVTVQNRSFVVSFVYAFNFAQERRRLWSYLVTTGDTIGMEPWMVLGDFNVMLCPNESSKFDGSQIFNQDMKDFKDCLEEVGLFDHIFSGPTFTWINNQDESFQARKLDRVLVNEQWLNEFLNSSVGFLLPGCSDHCSAKVVCENRISKPPKPFKMLNFWVSHPKFLEVVENSWKMPVNGNPMVKLHCQLKRLKGILKDFNKENFSQISERVV